MKKILSIFSLMAVWCLVCEVSYGQCMIITPGAWAVSATTGCDETGLLWVNCSQCTHTTWQADDTSDLCAPCEGFAGIKSNQIPLTINIIQDNCDGGHPVTEEGPIPGGGTVTVTIHVCGCTPGAAVIGVVPPGPAQVRIQCVGNDPCSSNS